MNPTRNTNTPEVIPLWPGGAPGSETWTQQEQETVIWSGLKVVRNIAQPTLTAYLPTPSTANGAAVIVCPGGAFHFLSIDMEGTDVAHWLNGHGVAAFVCKYRLIRTGDDFPEDVEAHLSSPDQMAELMKPLRPLIVADAQRAIRLVRGRAAEWGIAPDRIGIMGFSAGGVVTENVARLHDAGSRPDFAGVIYGADLAEAAPVPPDAPPLFILCAGDDEMATSACVPLHAQWRAAGHPAELHIYAKGGHGFGMKKLGLPTDTWIERFYDWMQALGVTADR